MVVFSEFPGMGSLWHCFTHMTGRGLRYPEAPQPCDPGSKIEPAELVHSFSHNFANPPAGGQMWTGISHETIGNTLNQCKSYGMVFGFSMTFRLILLIFQVVISNNHPQYGNGWDKSFTLWEQLLDCKPCHSGSGIIPSYVAPNDLIPSHIEKNSHFQPGSCQTTWCSKWLPCGFVGKQVRTRFDPVL